MIVPLDGYTEKGLVGAPMSSWSKSMILSEAKRRANKRGYEAIEGWPLKELRALCLKETYQYLCGSSTVPGAYRRTQYYDLDVEFINSLGGVSR